MRDGAWIRVGVLLALMAGAGCSTAPRTREPLNLTTAKRDAVAYHESGDYEADLAAVAEQASAWLTERAGRAAPKERLAVVFDVDETVLSNLPHMLRQDFGYTVPAWQEWVAQAEAPALAPVREVYGTARRLGYHVFFVTGRKDPVERPGTEANLAREGMGAYDRLILASPGDGYASSAERKAATRRAIEGEGFRIVASIGDQESDLVGGAAERTFKLPNPFYLVP